MATIKTTIKRRNGTGWDELRPKTEVDQITDFDANVPDNLNDLTNVNAPSPSDGQALVWDNSTSKWVPGTVASTSTLSDLGVTATAAELNKLDGVTATTAELNHTDGVTSNIQTQLNGKLDKSGGTITGSLRVDGGVEIGGDLEVVGNSIGFVDTNFDAKIEVSDSNPNGTGAVFNFYGDDVSRNATLSAEQFDGNAATTTKLLTARNIALTGDVTGSANFDGSADISITATVADDSHNHTIANIDGLQAELDGKAASSHTHSQYAPKASPTFTGTATFDNGDSTTVKIKGNDGGNALLLVGGDNQGTGAVEVGQSESYGGGISYNGDSNPAFVGGESSDHITFYRLSNGTRTEVFHYPHNSNTVNFNSTPTVGGTNVSLSGHTHSQYAPLASPALTGNPTAPTATAGDNDTTIATTAFVSTAISNLVNGASESFNTLKEIQDAMATDTELSNAIAGLTIGNGTQTITAGAGLSGGGSFTANQTGNSSITLNLDFSELTDIQLDVGSSTEMVVKVGDTEGRKALGEIDLSAFNNDAGWTSNQGDITSVTAGTGLTGGGTSGGVTLNVGAGTGISTAADSIAIANGYSPNTAIELTSSQNLNNITGAGFYYQTANADTTGNNYPSSEAGSLLVQKSAGAVTQTYITYSSTPKIYVRTYYTSWGSWKRVFNVDYHPNADKWTSSRTITLGGDLSGSVSLDGSANVTLTAAVADDSHNHTIANVDGLQAALDGKAASSHSHSSLVAVSGDTMTGDLTMEYDGNTLENRGSHGIVFQGYDATFANDTFIKELKMDSNGNLKYGTNTIFHSGNDGSSSGLHADLLDNQQGSYYLDYNNFTNTPTIPTNNNQLTNGAGYTTNTGTVTNVTVGTGLDVSNGTTTPSISLDLSEFTDMTADVVGSQDELILLDSGAERRKLISEIKLSQFNNDAGFITTDTNTQLSTEQVQDIVGGMVSSNSESGLSATYDDTNGKLNFALTNDPTITLTGDVTGSGTMTNLGNVSITATVADDSHNHTIANVDGLQTALNGKQGDLGTGSTNQFLRWGALGVPYWDTVTASEVGAASSSHSHGSISSTGTISSNVEIGSGDHFLISDDSAGGVIRNSGITFGSSTTQFLANNGTWQTLTIPTNNNQLTNGAGYVTGSHSHSTSNITSGNFNTARLGTGTATSGYVLKSDGDGTASWAAASGGGSEYEWEYVTKVTGSTTLTYSSMTPATYEYKFVVEVQTTGEDTSNQYIRINNDATSNEYSYQYQSVTQTAETTETALNAGDAATTLIYTGADLSSYSNGGNSGSTIHRAEFIYSLSPYSTAPGLYTATVRGWAHTHWVSQTGTSYDGMVQSTFVGTKDNIYQTEQNRIDYVHSINAGGTDYHEMRVYRRERK